MTSVTQRTGSAASFASPELQVVAAAVRCVREPGAGARLLELAGDELDWALVFDLAQRHRVTALVASGLAIAGLTAPDGWSEAFMQAAAKRAANDLAVTREAVRIAAALQRGGVGVKVLKGAVAAVLAFGRLGLRENHDVDLLVDEAEVERARRLLVGLGYEQVEPGRDLSSAAVARWRRAHKDMVFADDRGFIVELHWRLFDNPHLLPLPSDLGSRQVNIGALGALSTLPDDITFAYLCCHGAEHAWSRLKWLADVSGLVGAQDVPGLARLYGRCRDLGVGRAAAQALLLGDDLGLFDLPQALRSELDGDLRTRLLLGAARRSISLGDGAELEASPLGSTVKNLSHYLLRDSWRFWVSEFWFDLTDVSGPDLPEAIGRMGWLARPAAWIWRRRAELSRPTGA